MYAEKCLCFTNYDFLGRRKTKNIIGEKPSIKICFLKQLNQIRFFNGHGNSNEDYIFREATGPRLLCMHLKLKNYILCNLEALLWRTDFIT